jgi:hypothetical protein
VNYLPSSVSMPCSFGENEGRCPRFSAEKSAEKPAKIHDVDQQKRNHRNYRRQAYPGRYEQRHVLCE